MSEVKENKVNEETSSDAKDTISSQAADASKYSTPDISVDLPQA